MFEEQFAHIANKRLYCWQESIPFSETRMYVQSVLRNAEVYRRLYGRKSP